MSELITVAAILLAASAIAGAFLMTGSRGKPKQLPEKLRYRITAFTGNPNPRACQCRHKLSNTGGVFYQSVGLLQCSICGGWQGIRKPIK